MQQPAKLSDYEYWLVQREEVMVAKNSIMTKTVDMFALLSEEYMTIATNKLPVTWTDIHPKISKGEQYKGLPYVMLDYPRNFTKQDKFAIRTMFWWGHHFSIHLHLSGTYLAALRTPIQAALQQGMLHNWYGCIHAEEWHHHFDEENYRALASNETNILAKDRPFLKLAKKIPLKQWNEANSFLLKSFVDLVIMLEHHAPIR